MKQYILSILIMVSVILLAAILSGCNQSEESHSSVEYVPQIRDDWEVSTPEDEGLDPKMVNELYQEAAKLDTIFSLLVIKNGKLVAEQYFNEGSISTKYNMQSASKSYTSVLVGLALEQGCLTSLDQPMLDFFPEYSNQIKDPRKREITIRHLLQMRSGYPWEESHPDLWAGLMTGDFLGMMVHYPLVNDPGSAFHYSNVSSHYLGVIVDRACGTDLRTFAEEQLFKNIDSELGEWWSTSSDDRYPMGASAIHVNARDAAKFGLLYLNEGVYDGNQVLSAEWVRDSLKTYSENAFTIRVGRNIKDIGYGYQWWSARSGDHHYNLAWGHGGQLIVLVEEYDMVIVVTAEPFFLEHNGQAWKHEKANVNLVANFIADLP